MKLLFLCILFVSCNPFSNKVVINEKRGAISSECLSSNGDHKQYSIIFRDSVVVWDIFKINLLDKKVVIRQSVADTLFIRADTIIVAGRTFKRIL